MKIRIWAKTNKAGSRVETTAEVDSNEWRDMSEQDRDKLMCEYFMESGMVEWNYEVEE